MRQHVLFSSIAAFAVAGKVAAAQTLSSAVKLPSNTTPIATTSFAPYVAAGALGNTPINLSLVAVDLGPNSRFDGTITFKPFEKSVAYLNSPVAVPNGDYSVQLAFARVNAPAAVTITRGPSTSSPLLVSCSLAVSINTLQTCNSGVFSITDGNLSLTLGFPTGSEVSLAKVTVNRWK
jgi:hypothetical protein